MEIQNEDMEVFSQKLNESFSYSFVLECTKQENLAKEEESEHVEVLIYFLSGSLERIPSFITFDCSFFINHFLNMQKLWNFIFKILKPGEYFPSLTFQAFAASLQTFINDHSIFLANLKVETVLSLHQQLEDFYRQSCLLIQILGPVLDLERNQINSSMVSKLLSLLYQSLVLKSIYYSSDWKLLCKLFTDSSFPYFKILSNWIFQGKFEDPFQEFIIDKSLFEEKNDFIPEEMWEKAFILRKELPCFLKSLEKEILKVGKLSYILNYLGKNLKETLTRNDWILDSPHLWFPGDSIKTSGDQHIIQISSISFEIAFQQSLEDILTKRNFTLVHSIVFKQEKLQKFFQTMRRLFFLKPREIQNFTTNLFQNIYSSTISEERHLSQKILRLIHDTLASLDEFGSDHFAINLQSSFSSEIFQKGLLYSFPLLEFSYQVDSPLNLIITKSHQKIYFQITTLLFQIKWCKFLLEKILFKESLSKELNHSILLMKFKFLHFINSFHSYVENRVLVTLSDEFDKTVSSCFDFEILRQQHTNYCNLIQDQCFVSSKAHDIFILIKHLFHLTWKFSNEIQMKEQLKKIDIDFNKTIRTLLEMLMKIITQKKLSYVQDLIFQLNFNEHFSFQSIKFS